ncbi:hypothetical protein ACU4GH_29005 [Bradyrhizobium betae]
MNQLDSTTSLPLAVALIGYSSVVPAACMRAFSVTSPVCAIHRAVGEHVGDVDRILAVL